MIFRCGFVVALALTVSALAPSRKAAAAQVASNAPDASVSENVPWLSQRGAAKAPSADETKREAGPSAWRSALALLVVGGVGAAAVIVRRRRRSSPSNPASTVVHVVSGARIGPKAHAVVVEVAGRNLLLGVTDSSVTSLGWLDNVTVPAVSTDLAADDSVPMAPVRPTRTTNTTRVDDSLGVEPRAREGRFREVLDRALGVEPGSKPFVGNPGVAALIAARTEDVVSASPHVATQRMGSPIPVDGSALESQVAGLLRRRRTR